MHEQEHSESNPISESVSYEDSDDDMFCHLAPVNTKPSISIAGNQHSKLVLAKMKRLIGPSLNNKTVGSLKNGNPFPQQSKQNANKKQKSKKAILSEQSKFQSEDQSVPSEPRDRSRNKKSAINTAESIKSSSGLKKGKTSDAAIFSIQKQVVKQNDKLFSNKITSKNSQLNSDEKPFDAKKSQKMEKFAEMEKLLFVPVEELPVLRKTSEQIKEEKREKKRVDRMLDKKYKEFKVGKVKDQASNCVFNGIEDYFN